MCGIAGIVSFNTESYSISKDLLAMSKAIRHRGPDDEGYLLHSSDGVFLYGGDDTPVDYYSSSLLYAPSQKLEHKSCTVGLLHRRLSIIDLSVTGHQPLKYQNLWITYNGEIYNYLELKEDLLELGYQFVSSSDTEVVVAAYKQWGADCVHRFNGMWAFAIYDPDQQLIFASRDRLGVKPFYYLNNKNLFAFASEQKAFLATSFYKKEVNVDAFIDYFVLDLYEQEPEGVFKNILELFPGHHLTLNIKTGEIKTTKYFNIEINNAFELGTTQNYKERILNELTNAIRLRLRSDVLVGSCLSGGIDSSSIVGIMATLTPQTNINLFTAAMHDKAYDESNYAHEVVKRVKGNWFKTYPTTQDLAKDFNDLLYSQDIPIWSTSTYAQFSVMKLAKENHTKVLLDGQGSDELFGGYPVHLVPYYSDKIKAKGLISVLNELMAQPSFFKSTSFLIKRWLADFKMNTWPPALQLKLLKSLHPEINALSPDLEPIVLKRIEKHRDDFFDKTPSLNEYLFYETYNHRLKSYLKCEDRCSMWHSVESRTPFADDVNLLKLAFEIPAGYKIKEGQLKYLLRQSVKDFLPHAVYNRKDKMGYNTPNNKWIGELLKQRNFFSSSNGWFKNTWIKENIKKLLITRNPRVFKLLVSDAWLGM